MNEPVEQMPSEIRSSPNKTNGPAHRDGSQNLAKKLQVMWRVSLVHSERKMCWRVCLEPDEDLCNHKILIKLMEQSLIVNELSFATAINLALKYYGFG